MTCILAHLLLQPVNSDSPTELSSLLSLLLGRCVTSANPHVRQAACVWLLAVVSKCSCYAELQSSIMSTQDAFVSLLSETDGRRWYLCVRKFIVRCFLDLKLRHGDSVDNTVEENSGVFSLIRMHWLPSAVQLCTNEIFQFSTGGAS